jgi:UDP-N-acetylmuramoylalanine--D-glutamate ligase
MDELRGKRIVILGLARQGTALARFAVAVGAEVVVSDLRAAEAMQEEVSALKDLDITYVFGEHPMSLLEGTDVLAVSGGVPSDAPLVSAARRRGLRVTNDSLEFLKRCPAPTMGITGSAGKTTTTALTGAMGRKSGKTAWVGGNIGQPLISHVHEIGPQDFVVQELSSFQLEIWSPEWGHEQMASPHVAAVLNVTPNHLDRHKTMENYSAAKANVLRFQSEDDVAVLCADDAGAMALRSEVRGRLRTYSLQEAVGDGAFVGAGQVRLRGDGEETVVCHVGEVRLRGEHNLLNVLAAVTLADSAGVGASAMREAIATFDGVPHRLEPVATVRGVQYVNDSIATAPERALAAVNAFSEPLVLLAGGRDKEMVWDRWARRVAQRVRHVVLFGELASTLEDHLRAQDKGCPDVTRVGTLEEAVLVASKAAHAGDVVLLAPGGTSYDAFRDFEERGRRFRELVARL